MGRLPSQDIPYFRLRIIPWPRVHTMWRLPFSDMKDKSNDCPDSASLYLFNGMIYEPRSLGLLVSSLAAETR